MFWESLHSLHPVYSEIQKKLGCRAWKGGWSTDFVGNILSNRYCSLVPNIASASWLWRISRGIRAKKKRWNILNEYVNYYCLLACNSLLNFYHYLICSSKTFCVIVQGRFWYGVTSVWTTPRFLQRRSLVRFLFISTKRNIYYLTLSSLWLSKSAILTINTTLKNVSLLEKHFGAPNYALFKRMA